MGMNQEFQQEVRRLAFRSRLTPLLAAVWLIGGAIVVASLTAPSPWVSDALDAVPWVVFGAILVVGGRARANIRSRSSSPSPRAF